jgi:hypothetical protein
MLNIILFKLTLSVNMLSVILLNVVAVLDKKLRVLLILLTVGHAEYHTF